MGSQRSVGKFCSITVTNDSVGASDSIVALNGALLGEGAEAFCTSSGQMYRWTSASIAAFAPVFITPSAGGGTWVMQNFEQFLSCSAFGSAAFTAGAAQATLGINLWTEIKTGGGFYTTAPGFAGNLVTINSAVGFMTLANAVGSFRNVPLLVTMQFSVSASEALSAWEFDLTPVPGGNVGANVQSQTAAQATLTGPGQATSVTLTRLFVPTANVAYYPVFRCVNSGTATLYTAYYQMSVVSAGSST